MKELYCYNICVAKTKALISCAVTAQLICVFVFPYAKIRFFDDGAQIIGYRIIIFYRVLAPWLSVEDSLTWSRGYKTFMLNSAENEIYPAHKC